MENFSLMYPLNTDYNIKTLTDEAINDLSIDYICDALTKDNFEKNCIRKIMTEITDSKEVIILVNGHSKARALAATIEGSVSQAWTCSALQMHRKAIIVCDEPACGELKVDTYKYFKDIESDNLDPDKMI